MPKLSRERRDRVGALAKQLFGLVLVSAIAISGVALGAESKTQPNGNGPQKRPPFTLIPLPPMPTRNDEIDSFVIIDDSKLALFMTDMSGTTTVMLDGSGKIARRSWKDNNGVLADHARREIVGWEQYQSNDDIHNPLPSREVVTGGKTISFGATSQDMRFSFADFRPGSECLDPAASYFRSKEAGETEGQLKVLVVVFRHPMRFPPPPLCGTRLYDKPHLATRVIVPVLMAAVDDQEALYLAGRSYLPMPFVIKYPKGSGIVGDGKTIFVLDKSIVDDIRKYSVDEYEAYFDARPSLKYSEGELASLIEHHLLDYIEYGMR